MHVAENRMLQEAIEAARQGNRARARDLLARLLRADQKDPAYWLWMSAVVETEREQVYCLQTMLKLDPESAAPRRGLILLGSLEPTADDEARMHLVAAGPTPAPPEKKRTAKVRPNFPNFRRAFRRRAGPWWSVRRNRERAVLGTIGTLVIAGFIAGVILYLGPVVDSVRFQIAAANFTKTPTPTRTPTPSPTPTATITPTPPPPTATPVDLASTPLAMVLKITHTPTALYAASPHPGLEAYSLGLEALLEQDWEQVIALMNQVAESNPQAADAYYFAGEAYRMSGRGEEAIAAYEASVRANPNFAPGWLGQAMVRLGQGRREDALYHVNQAIQADPNYADAYVVRAQLASEEGNYEAATADLEIARSASPDSPLVKIRLSLALSHLGRYGEALAEAAVGNLNDPTILEGYLALGTARNALGRYQAAERDLDLYLVYASADKEGWTQRGMSRIGLKEYQGALEDFDRALLYNSQYLPARLGRAETLLGLQAYEEALEGFEAVLKVQASYRAHLGEGLSNLYLGNPREAVSSLQEALALQPESFEASLNLGRAQFQLEKFADAIGAYSAALTQAHKPTVKSEVLVLRAQAYEALEDFELAIQDWEAVIKLNAASVEILALATERVQALTPTATPTVTPTPAS